MLLAVEIGGNGLESAVSKDQRVAKIEDIAMNLRGLPYGIHRIDEVVAIASNRSKVESQAMNEVDVNERLRELCQQILQEQDPQRVEELIGSLKDTVQAAHDEARLRMSYVARHYRGRLESVSSNRGAEQLTHASGIRAVLQFLGLGAGMRLGREIEG